MYRCCSGVTRDCPRNAHLWLWVPRCCHGCPNVPSAHSSIPQDTQMLPQVSRRHPRILRYHSRCPDVAQMLLQSALLSPLDAQLSHPGAGSTAAALALGKATSSSCPVVPGPHSPARPGMASLFPCTLWIFGRSLQSPIPSCPTHPQWRLWENCNQ